MCKAFSCICPEGGAVIWKLGVDSHAELIHKAGLRDYTSDPKHMTFAKIEITPNNGDYHKPDKWTLHIDESITPTWWSTGYEAYCWDAHQAWCQQLYKILDTKKEIVNPFKDVKPPKKIGKKHIKLLQKQDSVWASVWASVRASVGDSVWDSVRDSVWDSVWDSVRDSVGDGVRNSVWGSVRGSVRASVRASVGDSVWGSVRDNVGDSVWGSIRASVGDSVGDGIRASVWDSVRDSARHSVRDSVWDSIWIQIGSLFNIPRGTWQSCEKLTDQGYPFQSCVDLWNLGLVPSFDGRVWRLHGGPKVAVLFEIGGDKLRKYK